MTRASAELTETDRTRRRVWTRGLVHLGLLLTAAGALATLTVLYIHNAIHADIGLVFVGLVVVHLLPTAGDDHLVAESMKRLREPSPDARTAARNQNRISIYLHVFLP